MKQGETTALLDTGDGILTACPESLSTRSAKMTGSCIRGLAKRSPIRSSSATGSAGTVTSAAPSSTSWRRARSAHFAMRQFPACCRSPGAPPIALCRRFASPRSFSSIFGESRAELSQWLGALSKMSRKWMLRRSCDDSTPPRLRPWWSGRLNVRLLAPAQLSVLPASKPSLNGPPLVLSPQSVVKIPFVGGGKRVQSTFPASQQQTRLAMRALWHSLLMALAFILTAVASIVPHPFDRLIASVVQLCFFLAELLK